MTRRKKRVKDLGLMSNRFNVSVPQKRRRRKKTDAEKANSNRFTEAAEYGKNCMLDPELKAMYDKKISKRKNSGYTVAFSDYLNPPEVHYIKVTENESNGVSIAIKATDDFDVVSVKVIVLDPEGKVLETGAAIRHRLKRQMWKYETNVVTKDSKGATIKAIAEDHAENKTEEGWVIE